MEEFMKTECWRRFVVGFSSTLLLVPLVCSAQNAPPPQTAEQQALVPGAEPRAATPAEPPPTALPTPVIVGPLQALPPVVFETGPVLGNIAANGILSGFGMWQGNHVPGDAVTQAALSNGQVFIQKTNGWWQFYVQAGAYTLPALATPFLATDKTMTNFYGPVPV